MTLLADAPAVCPNYHLCWNDYLQTQFSPAHLFSELGFTIAFDLLLIPLALIVWKKFIKPLIVNDVHEAYDEGHGLVHHDDHLHVESDRLNPIAFGEFKIQRSNEVNHSYRQIKSKSRKVGS